MEQARQYHIDNYNKFKMTIASRNSFFLIDIEESSLIYWLDRVKTGKIYANGEDVPSPYNTCFARSECSISPHEENWNPLLSRRDNIFHVWTGIFGYLEMNEMIDLCRNAANIKGKLTTNEKRLKNIYNVCLCDIFCDTEDESD